MQELQPQASAPANAKFVKPLAWIIILLAGSVLFSSFTREAPTAPARKIDSPGPSAEESMAIMINLNGHLCAQVKWLRKTGDKKFDVECVEYRGGSRTATYHVDMLTGRAAP